MKKTLFLLCMPFMLASCGSIGNNSSSSSISSFSSSSSLISSSSESISTTNSESSSSSISSESSSNSSSSSEGFIYNNPEYYEFFNPATRIYVIMDFDETALVNLSEMGGTYDSTYHDVYHPCTLTLKVNDKTIVYENAGARMKGNTSRTQFIDEYHRFNGYPVNFKVNVSTLFDDEYYEGIYEPLTDTSIKNRRFFNDGKKLDFKWNRNFDETFTKENYANYILEQEGVMAQKVNNCKLTIKKNGEVLSGYDNIPYHVYETIDKQFLQRRLPSEECKGNLYKGGWNGDNAPCLNYYDDNLMGVEDNYRNIHYTYSLKTNESKNNNKILKDCIKVLSADDQELVNAKSKIEEVIDVDYFIKYCALMWVIGNPDDFRYNQNNTYFYFNSVNNKMYFIPYDNDRCFGINIDGAMDLSSKDPNDIYAGFNGSGTMRPRILRRVVASNDLNRPLIVEWHSLYLNYCKQYANIYLNSSKFNTYTNSFAYVDDEYDYNNMSFATYASRKLGTINY